MRTLSTAVCRMCIAALGLALVVSTARAQEIDDTELVHDEVTFLDESESPWSYFVRVAFGAAFGSSKNVVGTTDGNTWTFNLQFEAAADYYQNGSELRLGLSISEAMTRTPVVDEFVKSVDIFDISTMYLYHIPSIPWFGPFARVQFTTALLPGADIRGSDHLYVINRVDGTTDLRYGPNLELTDPFQPWILKETVGLFAQPEIRPEFQFEGLLGFGARQVSANDQLAVQDDADTPEIEVTELESYNQAGAELGLFFWGVISEGKMTYAAFAEFMTPFINDLAADDDRSAWELTNINLGFTLGLRVVEWLGFDYELRVIREPQLLDDWQVSNLLLLTVAYTFVEQAREPAAE